MSASGHLAWMTLTAHYRYGKISVNDIQIFDDLLPQGYADAIEYDLTRSKFPWYYIDDVTNNSYGNNSGLVHLTYDLGKDPTDYHPFIKPLVYHIASAAGHSIKQLLRIRIGFLYPTVNHNGHNTPHVDFTFPHYTACYYVSDSDGGTVLFNKFLTDMPNADATEETMQQYVASTNFETVMECAPKKNRVCIFDGLRFHASTKPQYTDRRLVITVNYIA